MLSRKTIASVSARTVILLAALALPNLASAGRGVAGLAGRGHNAAGTDCLQRLVGAGLYNICDTFVDYSVTIPVDSSGSKIINVNAYQSEHGDVKCQAFATNSAGSTVSISAQETLPVIYTSQDLALDAVSVPGAGTINLTCVLGPTGKINTIRY